MRLRNAIKLEDNVPIPVRCEKLRQEITKAMSGMEVGQSFKLAADTATPFYVRAKRLGITVKTRKVGDGTYRVWRTS